MTTYATEIRDATAQLLTAAAASATPPLVLKKIRTNWGWPLATEDMPALSIFVPKEQLVAEGDGNAGEPSFVHDVTIAVVGSFGYDVPEALDASMSAMTDIVLPALLTTPAFLKLFESIEKVDQTTVFDKDGVTFIAEVQFDITVRFRTDWPPNVPDNFESVTVISRPLGKDDKTPPTELTINISQE